ncbi:MAG TPA: hypothetical protein VNF68_07130 [Candidatus Baltobacteraceae bacterium]|nr:hypothetical protein [Candidatus Baltobacteraceae bacterium]
MATTAPLLPSITAAPQNAGWTPYQVASTLQFPVLGGYGGSGKTIAIFGDEAPIQADLDAYLRAFDITYTGRYSVVSVDGSAIDPDGLGEATLDVETIMGLAPSANIEFYTVQDFTRSSFIAAYEHALDDPNVDMFSISYGGCEVAGFTDTMEHPLIAQAAAARVAFFADAGDQGDECYISPKPYQPGVYFPASDPDVTGVGGNENYVEPSTYSGPTLTLPVAWNDLFFGTQGATGGGASTLFPIPSYQVGLSGVASTTMRNVPDISLPAEGVAIYLGGQWQTWGGTSWGGAASRGDGGGDRPVLRHAGCERVRRLVSGPRASAGRLYRGDERQQSICRHDAVLYESPWCCI